MQSIDPWNADSINDASLQAIVDWLKDQEKALPEATESDPGSAGKLDDQALSQELLKKLLNTKSDALMAQAISLGASMLPEVRERLSHAFERTRLRQSSFLVALASLNGETHRAEAEKVAEELVAVDDFFGTEATASKDHNNSNSQLQATADFDAALDSDQAGLPSKWLANWYSDQPRARQHESLICYLA